METIQVKDRKFTISITEEEILKQVDRVAAEINRDFAGKNPLFLSVLNGAFMFTSDLMKRITIPCEVQFVKLSSYDGMDTTGKVKKMIGLNDDIKGRSVVIVEDIVDTGITMKNLLDDLKTQEPAEVDVCALLVKPEKLKVELELKYVAMQIPNGFILGYGLDYDGYGRNYPNIYTVVKD